MDFTLSIYKQFLETFFEKGYKFVSFKDYLEEKNSFDDKSIIILRHDVDHIPLNSLKTAEIENSLGITGVYYFRVITGLFDIRVIEKIASLGHEVGYHYEDIDLVRRSKISKKEEQQVSLEIDIKEEEELLKLSYESFCKNLNRVRALYPVKTVCAHGSPLSPYDNKALWGKYDYRELGIIGEPTFDIDWNEFAYFTDTGRRWNASNVNVRDKVISKYHFNFKTTQDIINNINILPKKIMFTVHPHRWFSPGINWGKELLYQNMKNSVKYFIVKKNKSKEKLHFRTNNSKIAL